MNKHEKYTLTLLLAYFLGLLGIHRFVNGKIGTGIIMLLTVGGFGIWYIIDLILIMSNDFKNASGETIGYEGSWKDHTINIVLAIMIAFSVFGNAIGITIGLL